jgi:DNA helicase-2/ATP-dependent DNA helicase PcrA
MELNSQQQIAVNHMDGPCLVLAGPGSGKTAVLTSRIDALIKSGIPAGEILVITFTKAAAIEMKERFDRLSDNIYPVTFGTFHSLFWGILQKEKGLKSTDILIGNERAKIIKEAMIKANLRADDTILTTALTTELSAAKNACVPVEQYQPKYAASQDLIAFSREYAALKKKYNLLDFDDMLSLPFELFRAHPEILKKWQSKYKYILVDEMQDMNELQFQLMAMLSKPSNNLFCVGDDDQSIYGFRGANPKIMQNFVEVYPETKIIVLEQNYRNPANITNCAMNLISNNKIRFNKDIKTNKPDGTIKFFGFEDESDEAEGIITEVLKAKVSGTKLDEMVILYRNHSDARYLVDRLIQQKIPFFLKEKMPNIYTHFVIEDIESYFQIALGNSTKARLLTVINRPVRFLHRRSIENTGTLEGMRAFYRDSPSHLKTVEALISDFNLIGKMSPAAAINYIKNVMGYGQFLREEAIKNGLEPNEYLEVLEFFKSMIKDCKTIGAAITKLNDLRLKIDHENKNKTVDRTGKLGLYTLHSSKGLEFKNVFIISANDGVIPSNKADSREEMEAERRLFYVGITRTKEKLFITYTNKKNRDKSRFLDELDYSSSSDSP